MTCSSNRSHFYFNNGHHRLAHGEAAADLMLESCHSREEMSAFSDWSFYQDLRGQPGCVAVEISQLHVDHSSWFLTGLQTTFKSTFSDGRPPLETDAPLHEFQRFRYRQYGQSTRSTLRLLENEYITNLSFRRVDQISDRISIQTNLRQVSFGSVAFASTFQQSWLLPELDQPQAKDQTEDQACHVNKIVALAGITSEMSEQMGCFSESLNWLRLKDWILIRNLVDKERAYPKRKESQNASSASTTDMVQSLVLDTNEDIYNRVLTFLIPSK